MNTFEQAEQAHWSRFGLDPVVEHVELRAPRMRARVLRVGKGDPVFYLHGGGACASIFASLAARVPGRAILVDRPACGGSDPFDYRGVDLRAHAVDFMRSTFDALRIDRVPIVANSMGGLWSLWFALAAPERVSSLVLLGCPAMMLGTSAPFGMRLLSVRGLGDLMFAMEPPSPANVRKLFARMGHDPSVLDEPTIELSMAMQRLPAWRKGFASLLANVLGPGGPRITLGEEDLRALRVPLSLIWGDGDTFGAPSVGKRACAIVRGATMEVVPGGHLPWLDAPDRCAEIVRERLVSERAALEMH
jgi:pimeloyl-ACP methyl ester carboxylesterase